MMGMSRVGYSRVLSWAADPRLCCWVFISIQEAQALLHAWTGTVCSLRVGSQDDRTWGSFLCIVNLGKKKKKRKIEDICF